MLTKIAVLVSGGGTNLQALIDSQGRGELAKGRIALVVADKPGIGAIGRAERAGIPCAVIPRGEADFEERVLAALAETVRSFGGPIINIHPSLIPAFCGKGFYGLRVHQAALDYGVKVTGATVHYVNAIPDGGTIILQKAVDILPGDTAESLQRRVMEQAEWTLLPQAAALVAAQIVEEKENTL